MTSKRRRLARPFALLGIATAGAFALTAAGSVSPPAFARPVAPDSVLLQRMLDAEDSRASTPAALAPLLEGLRSSDVETRVIAARALGRIERPENLPSLEPMLTDQSPVVRAEAVNAIAQIAKGDGPTGAPGSRVRAWPSVQALIPGLGASEVDPVVRGAMARSLGRLPYPTEDVARTAVESIVDMLNGLPSDGALGREPWFGVLHGVDAILRRFPNVRTSPAVIRVALLPRVPSAATGSDSAWSRETNVILAAIRGRVLGAAAGAPNGIDAVNARDIGTRFATDLGDSDPQVRRQVVTLAATAAALDDAARTRVIDAGLGDPAATVRIEAVRGYARRRGATCGPLITATRDANAHVVLTAVDALATPCEPASAAVERVVQLVRELPRGVSSRTGTRGSWHAGAHAIVSLARIAPDSARAALPRLVAHPVWQVRMYAARAAATLGDTATLARLAGDQVDNVRDAAVNGFADVMRPPAGASAGMITRNARVDGILISQLERGDHQLIMDAAKALEGSTKSSQMMEALYATLARVTAKRSENSRDPRMALLERIQGLEQPSGNATRIEPYVTDYDPAIAERAAAILRAWGKPDAKATPRLLPMLPVSLRDVAGLRDARLRITMAPQSGGGSFEVRLFASEAPATVNRIVAAARRGYYNGLTFHREATNFVIQGGSPGANEYVGAQRFMRDEVGLRSHARGTLGISTRGRDTGDEQIFVNTIDNWRLDHDYTVFGEIVRGIEVADAVLEGDVIARIEVVGK
ncbi:MAG TPA: peptidylprolyl isomerase [Gemmatimonadaceae bacterium]|nr:peptidylprolyl isomerase [Gemmatimonadaceae bacterium]